MRAQPPLTAKLDDERLEAGITTQGTVSIERMHTVLSTRRYGLDNFLTTIFNLILFSNIAQCLGFLAHHILKLMIVNVFRVR